MRQRAVVLAVVLAAFAGGRAADAATTNAFLPPVGGPRIAALGGHIVAGHSEVGGKFLWPGSATAEWRRPDAN